MIFEWQEKTWIHIIDEPKASFCVPLPDFIAAMAKLESRHKVIERKKDRTAIELH